SDLDVVIHPKDLLRALTCLQELGYHVDHPPIHQLRGVRLQQLVRRFHEHSLFAVRGGTPVKVDLHWRLSDDNDYFPTDFDALLTSSASCVIGGRNVRTLSSVSQLTYLAFHAGGHQCHRLSWLFDFAVAADRIADQEWNSLLTPMSPTIRRMVICVLLTLESLSLTKPLDHRIDNVDQWRAALQPAVQAMIRCMTDDPGELLGGAWNVGQWRYRLTGRFRPWFNSMVKAVLPGPQDLLQPGLLSPYVSRWRYIVHKSMASAVGASDGST
ncbi:MAG: nucleotidyltransferase family protein, partial [Planctomycetaceae bacterium]|nr:nucleotidyltransferase family protein [Planctomycetaceae bacterium]